jgi:hypothetical protein
MINRKSGGQAGQNGQQGESGGTRRAGKRPYLRRDHTLRVRSERPDMSSSSGGLLDAGPLTAPVLCSAIRISKYPMN